MAVISSKCPGCGAEPMPLVVQTYSKRDDAMIYAFVVCPTCNLPAALVLTPGQHNRATATWFMSTSARGNVDAAVASGWDVRASFPTFQEKEAPQHTPGDIARLFKQATSAQRRQENEAAGFLFGKTLEASIKKLAPETTGTLAQRIDRLAETGDISADVRKWAHEIRIIRNDAVHETIEPPPEEIAAIAEFTEAFLLFVFTMRRKYEDRKSKSQS
jgi:hypothetical protein